MTPQKLILILVLCVSFLLAPSLAQTRQPCPKIDGCEPCQAISDSMYSLNCTIEKKNHYNLEVSSHSNSLIVSCNNNSPINKLPLPEDKLFKNLTRIAFQNCHFRHEYSISKVLDRMGIRRNNLQEVILMNPKLTTLLTEVFFNRLRKVRALSILGDRKLEVNATKQIIDLDENALVHLDSLEVLFLKGLGLKEVPKGLRVNKENLLDLSLRDNQIRKLDEDSFDGLGNLRKLDLSSNRLTRIDNKIFDKVSELRELYLDNNLISAVDNDAFLNLTQLTDISMMNNRLHLLGPYEDGKLGKSFLRNCKSLIYIWFAHNRITHIYEDWLEMKHLFILNLEKNRFTKLSSQDLVFTSTGVNVMLKNNHISTIDIDTSFLRSHVRPELIANVIDIEGNPLNCDCRLYNFIRLVEEKAEPLVSKAYQFETYSPYLNCSQPPHLKNQRITDVRSETLMCPVEKKCFNDPCSYFWSAEYEMYIKDCEFEDLDTNEQKLRMLRFEEMLLETQNRTLTKEMSTC